MRKTGGGAATAGGMDFQHRMAAWVAVHVLAERSATPPWDFPADTTLEWLRCETEQPVDDLLVGTSARGLVFAQIKRTLQLSPAADSDLSSALDQFVRQFIACRSKTAAIQPWDRPLDLEKDRLVLVTSSTSSEPIKSHLRQVLRRVRNLHQDQRLDAVAANDKERQALSIVLVHLKRSWRSVQGADPSDDELRQFFSLFHVQVVDLDEGDAENSEAQNLLRSSVLRNPDDAAAVWTRLISLCAGLAAKRLDADRLSLQHDLLKAGLLLKVPWSYQNDIGKLLEYSEVTFNGLAHLAQIHVGSTKIKIQRVCIGVLQQAAEQNSILVVGEPGAGKSGALHDLIESKRQVNHTPQNFMLVMRSRSTYCGSSAL